MKAKRILKKLNYLPRWAWYLASLSIGGPVGALFAYLGFHALEKMAADQDEEDENVLDWDVNIDADGVHVHRRGKFARKGGAQNANTYQDEECTVTGEEDILAQWEKTERSARSAMREEPLRTAESEEPQMQDSEEIADVVRSVEDAIARIRRANDLIPDEELSTQLSSIENSCDQILSILRQRPQLLPELRTFLRYYLPTTLKLLDARVKLEKNAGTYKAREVRNRISEALGVIDKAFLKQVEALDEYRFIDLESEMDVLRDMLRADGLVDEDRADAQAAAKPASGTPLAGH